MWMSYKIPYNRASNNYFKNGIKMDGIGLILKTSRVIRVVDTMLNSLINLQEQQES